MEDGVFGKTTVFFLFFFFFFYDDVLLLLSSFFFLFEFNQNIIIRIIFVEPKSMHKYKRWFSLPYNDSHLLHIDSSAVTRKSDIVFDIYKHDHRPCDVVEDSVWPPCSRLHEARSVKASERQQTRAFYTE